METGWLLPDLADPTRYIAAAGQDGPIEYT